MKTRPSSFLICGWVAIAASAGLAQPPQDQSTPNIVIILVDDLGYGDLSSFGAADLRSPNIDQLMRSGMRMENFYANSPVCSPTRASLLTGRYPELVGVPGVIRTHADDSWGHLDPTARMLPGQLGGAGYRTALVGKWHLGLDKPNLPNQRGFDLFRGFLGDMMDDYFLHQRHGINYMRHNTRETNPTGHATDVFTAWACEFIEEQKDDANPFFLFLSYNAPHTPIQPPDAWLKRVRQRETGISENRAKLVALIEHLDDGIGQVVATLAESGQANNTLIIFTSDNGGQLDAGADNGPFRDGKQSMYEGGLRVPTCVVWPERIQPNSSSGVLGMSMDIFPSICELVGVSVGNRIDGHSLLPVWLGESVRIPQRDLFFHRREGNQRYAGLTINAIRRANWKLLQNSPFAPLELYNLAVDAGEQNDVASENPKKFEELSTALRRQVQRGGAVPWQPAGKRDDPATQLTK